MHNFPSSSTLELWKFSNLTFGGYLTGTTPVLSTRFSLFLFRRCYLEHVRIMWLTDDFWHYQLALSVVNLALSVGNFVTYKSYYHFPDKDLHGTYSLNGDNQQCSRRRTTHHRPQETSSNSRRCRRAPYQAKPWSRRAAAPKKREA